MRACHRISLLGVQNIIQSRFVQTLESPEIKMLTFPGLESPGKKHRSWKTLEKSWNPKVVVLKIVLRPVSTTATLRCVALR